MKPLVLASTSFRRRELLEWLGIPFVVVQPDFDEQAVDHTAFQTIDEYVRCLAAGKALSVVPQCGADDVILSGDTIVECDGVLLGKPRDLAHAREMLQMLRGRTHRVYSAVACFDSATQQLRSACSVTDVTFFPISDVQIDAYIATSEPLGKAGAYGIQGKAGDFVQRIEGSVTGVIGFPLENVVELLLAVGYTIETDLIAMQRLHLSRSW